MLYGEDVGPNLGFELQYNPFDFRQKFKVLLAKPVLDCPLRH